MSEQTADLALRLMPVGIIDLLITISIIRIFKSWACTCVTNKMYRGYKNFRNTV